MNILFICSRNRWRSPTAEAIFRNDQFNSVRSAGTEPSAVKKVNEKDIRWANLIFVMESKHRDRIVERFANAIEKKKIIVLDIPDDYKYMDPELIEVLKISVLPFLKGKE